MNANYISKLSSFLNEARAEVKKISWPSRDELIGSVIIVCLLVVFFAIILGAMDGVFGYLIRNYIS